MRHDEATMHDEAAMIVNRRWAIAAVVALTWVALTCHRAAAQTPQRTALDVAVIGISASTWPAVVAKDKGFFAEQGLDVTFVPAGASARVLQQVVAGAAPIGLSSLVDTFRAIDSGGGVKLFMVSQVVGPYRLIGGKAMKSIADLKGKRVMTGGPKDLTNLWWDVMARHEGLDSQKDVEVLYAGASTARLASLLSGAVDAAVLSPPQTFMAVQQGFIDLGSAAPYLGEFPTMGWHVNEKWAEANTPIVVAFAKANDEAVKYMVDPSHKEEVSAMLAKASGLSLDDALKTWDQSIAEGAFAPDGSVTVQAVKHIATMLGDSGDIKNPGKPADTFYDDRFTKAAAHDMSH
jgi:ABC-type nitrate/sulfonate/bicarbonate transport system substrate-binding protein